MKRVIFTTILIAAFGVADAQTDQGGWLIGASSDLSFTKTKRGDADASTFNFDTGAGYFLADNLVAGLNIGFEKSDELLGVDITTTAIGPFARYYLGGTFFVGAGYAATSMKLDGLGDAVKGSLLAFEAGYPIWLGDNVALEPGLNYSIGSGDLYEDTSIFGVDVGFSLYF